MADSYGISDCISATSQIPHSLILQSHVSALTQSKEGLLHQHHRRVYLTHSMLERASQPGAWALKPREQGELQSLRHNCKALSSTQLFLEHYLKPHWPESMDLGWEICSKTLCRHTSSLGMEISCPSNSFIPCKTSFQSLLLQISLITRA